MYISYKTRFRHVSSKLESELFKFVHNKNHRKSIDNRIVVLITFYEQKLIIYFWYLYLSTPYKLYNNFIYIHSIYFSRCTFIELEKQKIYYTTNPKRFGMIYFFSKFILFIDPEVVSKKLK